MFVEPYHKLKNLFDNEDDALLYLLRNDYINEYKTCNKCGSETKLYLNKKLFICKSYKCRKSISPLNGTIFSKLKLPLNIQLHILCYFLGKVPNTFISSWLNIDKNTVTSYTKLFRKYIKNKELMTPSKRLGGIGKIVEMDETKSAKRKYNKGRRIEGAWVIGGIERSANIRNGYKNLFLRTIKDRNCTNIDEIVKRYVKPGTTIYTDCWKGYNNLKNIGYIHKTVNHSKNFVDPITKAHTQTIEGTWSYLKRSILPRHRNNKNIMIHLKEFQWRRKNRKNNLWIEFLKDD